MAKKPGRIFKIQLWDCPNCGNKGMNALFYKECTQCGQVLSDDFLGDLNYNEQVFLAEGDPLYELAMYGPDWLCSCGRRNSGRYSSCECGAERETSEKGRGRVDKNGKTTGGIIDWYQDDSQLKAGTVKKKPGPDIRKILVPMIVIALILGLIGLFRFISETKIDVELTVTGHRWERAIDWERFELVKGEAWEDEVPEGARITSKSREIFGYKKVQTGTEIVYRQETRKVEDGYDLVEKTRQVIAGYETKYRQERQGNGVIEDVPYQEAVYKTESYTEKLPRYKEITESIPYEEPVYRDDPIYKYKNHYELETWVKMETLKAAQENRSPLWPKTDFTAPQGAPIIGDTRIMAKTESYQVLLTDGNNKEYLWNCPQNQWEGFEPGSQHQAQKNLAGHLVSIEDQSPSDSR
ncbi:MAG: hypothetical protein JXR70_03165 [Spirochaetales bacterium]|nr:hypothetical protein [Spirochaetales bacterium]